MFFYLQEVYTGAREVAVGVVGVNHGHAVAACTCQDKQRCAHRMSVARESEEGDMWGGKKRKDEYMYERMCVYVSHVLCVCTYMQP
jgi:hypothetical protein